MREYILILIPSDVCTRAAISGGPYIRLVSLVRHNLVFNYPWRERGRYQGVCDPGRSYEENMNTLLSLSVNGVLLF